MTKASGEFKCKTNADCLTQILPCDFVACDKGRCVCNTATISSQCIKGKDCKN